MGPRHQRGRHQGGVTLTELRRPIVALTADELRWTNPAPSRGAAATQLVWNEPSGHPINASRPAADRPGVADHQGGTAPSRSVLRVRSAPWLCENNSADRSGARLIRAECRSRMKNFVGAASLILVLRADNCVSRFHTARVRMRTTQCEQNESALLPIATVAQTSRHFA